MLEDAADAFNKAGNAYKLGNFHEDVSLPRNDQISSCSVSNSLSQL